jgi:hypothetical protein
MRREDEHKRFLKRLESERPQPSDDFLSTMSDRLAPNSLRRAGRWQVAFAGGLTTLLVLAFALTGGIGYAASAVQGGTTAVTSLVAGSSKADDADKPTATGQLNSARNQSGGNGSSSNVSSASERGNQQSSARQQYQEKVVICHIPPGEPENAHTISVSPNAVPAHLAHGDSLGPCPNGN